MPNNCSTNAAQIVADTIKKRQTFKVFDNAQLPPSPTQQQGDGNDSLVLSAIQTAGWAPFHYDRAVDGLAEPWRVDFLSAPKCQEVAANFFEWFDDVKPTNKLPAMLNCCGCLVLVSWLPQFTTSGLSEALPEKQRQVNEEHLAATAAYVQNLTLVLTAHDFGTYWSSGGQFRTPEMHQKLGLNHNGRLLAAIFVDYNPQDETLERLPGKLRNRRDPGLGWLNRIK